MTDPIRRIWRDGPSDVLTPRQGGHDEALPSASERRSPRILRRQRQAICRACGHVGIVRPGVRTDSVAKCNSCGARFKIRQIIGDRPARYHHGQSAAAVKAAQARAVLADMGIDDVPNDEVDDLFQRGSE